MNYWCVTQDIVPWFNALHVPLYDKSCYCSDFRRPKLKWKKGLEDNIFKWYGKILVIGRFVIIEEILVIGEILVMALPGRVYLRTKAFTSAYISKSRCSFIDSHNFSSVLQTNDSPLSIKYTWKRPCSTYYMHNAQPPQTTTRPRPIEMKLEYTLNKLMHKCFPAR